jgi:hypothetical protein
MVTRRTFLALASLVLVCPRDWRKDVAGECEHNFVAEVPLFAGVPGRRFCVKCGLRGQDAPPLPWPERES